MRKGLPGDSGGKLEPPLPCSPPCHYRRHSASSAPPATALESVARITALTSGLYEPEVTPPPSPPPRHLPLLIFSSGPLCAHFPSDSSIGSEVCGLLPLCRLNSPQTTKPLDDSQGSACSLYTPRPAEPSSAHHCPPHFSGAPKLQGLCSPPPPIPTPLTLIQGLTTVPINHHNSLQTGLPASGLTPFQSTLDT